MNKLLMAAALGAVLFAFGCGGDTTDTSGSASLRFIHAASDAVPFDVELQDAQIATNLAYGSSYPSSGNPAATVPAGLNTLDVFDTGSSTPLFDLDPTFVNGHIYTYLVTGLVSGGSADNLQSIVVDDAKVDLNVSAANLRFVNASPLMNSVDIYVTASDASITDASPTVSGLARYNVSSLLKLSAGAYRVRICPAGTKTPTIDTNLTATAGAYVIDVTEKNGSATVLQPYSGTF